MSLCVFKAPLPTKHKSKYIFRKCNQLSFRECANHFTTPQRIFYKKQIYLTMLDSNELDQLKITGTPELITVDFATMFNESYIDPAEEMKQQPVALSIGTSVYKDNSYLFRLVLW
jgi:hypothetical protein